MPIQNSPYVAETHWQPFYFSDIMRSTLAPRLIPLALTFIVFQGERVDEMILIITVGGERNK